VTLFRISVNISRRYLLQKATEWPNIMGSVGERAIFELLAMSVKAKFHYAIWTQTGSKLVADLSQSC